MLNGTKNVEKKNDQNVIEMVRPQKPDDFTNYLWKKLYFPQKASCVHIVLDCSDTHSVLNF